MSDKVYHVFSDMCIIINFFVYELITNYYVRFFSCRNLHISFYNLIGSNIRFYHRF